MRNWRYAALLLLPLAACTPDYPMDKADTWHAPAVSSNDRNLRVMVVDPHDLISGAGEDTSTGAEAAPGVARLVAGKRTPLPASGAAQFQSGGSPGSAPAGGGGGPAPQ